MLDYQSAQKLYPQFSVGLCPGLFIALFALTQGLPTPSDVDAIIEQANARVRYPEGGYARSVRGRKITER